MEIKNIYLIGNQRSAGDKNYTIIRILHTVLLRPPASTERRRLTQ